MEDDSKPNVQQSVINDPQTVVSGNNPPVLSAVPLTTKEVSDPTVRRNVPLETEEKPRAEVHKAEKKVSTEKKSSLKTTKPVKQSRSGGDPLWLRGALQLVCWNDGVGIVVHIGNAFRFRYDCRYGIFDWCKFINDGDIVVGYQ